MATHLPGAKVIMYVARCVIAQTLSVIITYIDLVYSDP